MKRATYIVVSGHGPSMGCELSRAVNDYCAHLVRQGVVAKTIRQGEAQVARADGWSTAIVTVWYESNNAIPQEVK